MSQYLSMGDELSITYKREIFTAYDKMLKHPLRFTLICTHDIYICVYIHMCVLYIYIREMKYVEKVIYYINSHLVILKYI